MRHDGRKRLGKTSISKASRHVERRALCGRYTSRISIPSASTRFILEGLCVEISRKVNRGEVAERLNCGGLES